MKYNMNNPIIDRHGNKFWYNEFGELNRKDGPAIEYRNGTKQWIKNGYTHRIDGPAVEYSDSTIYYFINGTRYDSLDEGLMDQAIG